MILTAQDRAEIMDLCSRYNTSTDDANVDAFMDCWREGEVAFQSPFGDLYSREEIRHFEQEHVTTGMAVGKRHLSLNVSIREEQGQVLVTNDLLVVEVKEAPFIVATGRYKDSKVVKTDKGWKFAYRKLQVDTGFMKLLEQMQSAHNL